MEPSVNAVEEMPNIFHYTRDISGLFQGIANETLTQRLLILRWVQDEILKVVTPAFKDWLRTVADDPEGKKNGVSASTAQRDLQEIEGDGEWKIVFMPSFGTFMRKNYPAHVDNALDAVKQYCVILNEFSVIDEVYDESLEDLLVRLHTMPVMKSIRYVEKMIDVFGVPDGMYSRNNQLVQLLTDKRANAPFCHIAQWSYGDWTILGNWLNKTRTTVPERFAEEQHRKASEAAGELTDVVGSPGSRSATLLKWCGSQTDLMYVMDCLKQAGLLVATDAAICSSFDYGSDAQKPEKTYRDTRSKYHDEGQRPTKALIDALIRQLQTGPSRQTREKKR